MTCNASGMPYNTGGTTGGDNTGGNTGGDNGGGDNGGDDDPVINDH